MDWLLFGLALYFVIGGLFALGCALARVRSALDVDPRVLVIILCCWPGVIWLVHRSKAGGDRREAGASANARPQVSQAKPENSTEDVGADAPAEDK